jgi:hypothetical protein
MKEPFPTLASIPYDDDVGAPVGGSPSPSGGAVTSGAFPAPWTGSVPCARPVTRWVYVYAHARVPNGMRIRSRNWRSLTLPARINDTVPTKKASPRTAEIVRLIEWNSGVPHTSEVSSPELRVG